MTAFPDDRPAIAIRGLTKRYDTFLAVDDISLTVARGDFFGFLGPNGAGKTTTINAIVGLATVTAGTIEIFGHDTVHDWRVARRLVGLAPQEYNFDRYLSIRDVLLYSAGYYGLRVRDVARRADDLLERFGLASKAKETYVKLSGGMKRRLSLARALIHTPQLLILDEPTAGVDVELRIELWEFLRELNAEGMTILLTTHYLEEAESLCRNIGIIEGGKLIAMESTQALLARQSGTTLTVTLDRPVTMMPPSALARGARADGRPHVVSIQNLSASAVTAALRDFESAGYTIENVDFTKSTLQDVFLDLTRRSAT